MVCSALLLVPEARATAPEGQHLRVTATLANVRADASTKGAVLHQVKQGDDLLLLGEADGWYHVQSAAGWQGYLKKELAEPIAPPPPVAAPAPPPAVVSTPASAPGPSGGPAIDHKGLECLLADQFPRLDARFEPEDVAKPRAYFRAGGTTHWYYVDMTKGAAGFEGVLPKPMATTAKIDYYLEALDRSFVSGRTQEYSPAVVKTKTECGSKMLGAVAASASKVIVGSAASDAPAIPEGFEATGIVTNGSGASSAAASGSHTLLFVAGGVVAVGAIALAAKGGSSSSSSGSSSSGSSSSGSGSGSSSGGVNITGTWSGPLVGTGSTTVNGVGVSCQYNDTVTLQFTQSGASLSGTAMATNATATCNVAGFSNTNSGISGTPSPFTGTASNGQLTLTVPTGSGTTVSVSGTYTASTMALQYNWVFPLQGGVNFTETGTMNLTKQ
jgi:hypothetical protein